MSLKFIPLSHMLIFSLIISCSQNKPTNTCNVLTSSCPSLFRSAGNFPQISSATLANDNSYVDITLNRGVYTSEGASLPLEITDFTTTFTQHGGTATSVEISSLTASDASNLAGGESVIRAYLNIGGAANGVETIEIQPASGSSIYDQFNVSMPSTQTTGIITLNSEEPPSILSTSLASNNSYIDVTFSTGVYSANNATGAITVSDLTLTFNQSTGTASDVTIVSLTTTASEALVGGESTIRVQLSVTGTPNGQETITITPVSSDQIFGGNGRSALANETTGAVGLYNQQAPSITGSTVSSDNSYIDVNFSAGVYTNSNGTGGATTGDFILTFTQGVGLATNTTISSVTDTSNQTLSGGETTIRIYLNITGTPSGNETIEINPANDISLYSIQGSATSSTETTGNQALNKQINAVFISSNTYKGNLGGVSGADLKCGTEASTHNLSGTYRSWITDNTTANSPSNRFTQSTSPYYFWNGSNWTKIASTWIDLTDGVLNNAINSDIAGTPLSAADQLWTNTLSTGARKDPTNHCSSWTNLGGGQSGQIGTAGVTSSSWTDSNSTVTCNQALRIICIEQ